MRISDWSSDVCSSDLGRLPREPDMAFPEIVGPAVPEGLALLTHILRHGELLGELVVEIGRASCREKSVSVRVDLGGRRIIKKKNKTKQDIVTCTRISSTTTTHTIISRSRAYQS